MSASDSNYDFIFPEEIKRGMVINKTQVVNSTDSVNFLVAGVTVTESDDIVVEVLNEDGEKDLLIFNQWDRFVNPRKVRVIKRET